MEIAFLVQAAVFLAASAIAAPLAKRLKISSVLGYLLAGILIGPYGLGFVYALYQVEGILHFAEFGVVLLLFLIGLELRPKRLWSMRHSVFGLGGAQVVLTALVLAVALASLATLGWRTAAFVGLALALSSTALVLQILDEKNELVTRHGRAAFSVLLMQDLAAIPLIALVPLFSLGGGNLQMSWVEAARALLAVGIVVIGGRYALSHLYRLVAMTGVREAMTASALLTVIGVAILMQLAGLSAALGAFIAGLLLADSEYRHQIEADLQPFEGLLLGLFFTAVGMSLNLTLAAQMPALLIGGALALVAIKALILYPLGRVYGLGDNAARRLAVALSQGGEFALVLFTAATASQVLDRGMSEMLAVIVTFSMLTTPLLLLLDETFKRAEKPDRAFDELPYADSHVVIAGFGRFGQIAARILRGHRISFTALDSSAQQVDFVAGFGSKIYYGDATRLSILEAAQTGKARAFVLAVDDIEASLKIAELVKRHFPHVPIYARARNRQHVYRLMDLGVTTIVRETFLSALDLTDQLLDGLGFSPAERKRTIATFRAHDERRLYGDYADYTEQEKMQARALKQAEELEELFRQDVREESVRPKDE